MRLFCCMIISQGSQGISAPYTQTLHARSSVLYLCDWKKRKNPNPFPIWKIGFGLYWFGAVDETKSEPEAPTSVTCPSMDFTRWSSEE